MTTTRCEDDAVVPEPSGPSLVELVSLGGLIAGCVLGGLGVGYWIGSATGLGTVMTFSGLALGLSAAVGASYVKIKKYL